MLCTATLGACIEQSQRRMEWQIVEVKLRDYNNSGNGEGWAQGSEMKGREIVK